MAAFVLCTRPVETSWIINEPVGENGAKYEIGMFEQVFSSARGLSIVPTVPGNLGAYDTRLKQLGQTLHLPTGIWVGL